jgi:hypothetical protein
LPVRWRGNRLDVELAVSLSYHDQSPVVNAVLRPTVFLSATFLPLPIVALHVHESS